MKMTSKKKYRLIQVVSALFLPIYFILVTLVTVLFNWDLLWSSIPSEGITTFCQWITIVLYRIFLYIVPALILMCFMYDKRYKTISRFVIWLNWILMLYTIANVTIRFMALDQTRYFAAFNSLDSVIGLSGFVFTAILKRKIEFGTAGTIVGEKL